MGGTGIEWTEVRDAAKHATEHSIPIIKNDWAPKVYHANVDNPAPISIQPLGDMSL